MLAAYTSNADSLHTASAPACAGVRLAAPHPNPSGVEEVDSPAAGSSGGGGADAAAEGGAGAVAAGASAAGVAVGFGEELSEMETDGGVSGGCARGRERQSKREREREREHERERLVDNSIATSLLERERGREFQERDRGREGETRVHPARGQGGGSRSWGGGDTIRLGARGLRVQSEEGGEEEEVSWARVLEVA
jgi:hypothetical protein